VEIVAARARRGRLHPAAEDDGPVALRGRQVGVDGEAGSAIALGQAGELDARWLAVADPIFAVDARGW
jgi:hypothetical protein